MQKLTPNAPEMQSADLLSENIERLKVLFPEAFTEGKIDFAVLKELLGDQVDEREEKYGLNWHGKRQARRLALTPSTGTLRPCPAESVNWDATQNLMIEGDNLEVLKLLQKSYAGKVKLIYIDPPYNTGKDFVYPDDFRDNIRNYLELTGQTDGEGRRISSNTEASGRFHTDWLNMMYPRLKLARNLLHQEGVIFVSIDDNEIKDLRIIMDDLYGEENFIATIIWQKRYSRENRGAIGDAHDYLLVYASDPERFKITRNLIPLGEKQHKLYKNINNDCRGAWQSVSLLAQGFRPNQMYEIIAPNGNRHTPPPGRCWAIIRSEFDKLLTDNRVYFGKDGNGVPRRMDFLHESQGLVPWTWWPHEEAGHTDEAKKEIQSILGSQIVFDTPKPSRLIERVLHIASHPDDLVLDFFAGSGTTAHAVLDLNKKDGGNRRFILVQLPEPTGQKEYPTIAEITKERVRRVIKKLNAEEAGQLDLSEGAKQDRGFRVFKLDTSNLKPWEPDPAKLEEHLFSHVDHILPDRSEQDLLFELLLKLGLELTVPMETRTIASKAVHAIGGGVLMVCLTETITRKEVDPLAMGILDWRRALAPAVATTFVFRDSAFKKMNLEDYVTKTNLADDVAKTNLAAILEQNLPASALAGIRSL
ncbi:MAG: site-specific DNA-methyltransferase [Magnetococcales bacterium]|nr:site-specific DNA-methyltransferase [Magnetococcales bacterium]